MPIPTARPLSRRPSGFLAAFLLCLGLLVAPAVQAAMPDAEFVQLCVEGDLAAVRRALQEGANPNAADDTGTIRYEGYKASNALICAASKSHLDLVNLLLAAGADLNAANKRGGTALMAANDDVRVAQALLAAGADPNAANEYGYTALMAGRTPAVLRALLKAGADPNAVDKGGETPIFYQAGADDPARVAELLAAGAEVNAVDKHGETALMVASSYGRYTNARVLRAAGADESIRNSIGKTAADMAKWKKDILPYVLFIVLPAVLGALLAVLALRCFIARFNPSWWLRDGRRNWRAFCWLCLALWPLMAVLVAFIILWIFLANADFGMV